jgi:CRISPR-associated endonuclease Csn1
VTGTVRKAWNLEGCLSAANAEVLDKEGKVKKKKEIRDITHLHHALDACVLGIAADRFPNQKLGALSLWELLLKRKYNQEERAILQRQGLFQFDTRGQGFLTQLPSELLEQIRVRLAEKRVVQHIPSRLEGLRVEQNTWRVLAVKDGEANLCQRMRQPDGTRPVKIAEERAGKLLGIKPANASGKLAKLKGALVIPDNFGVALDPQPTVIPFHKVWTRLRELKTANGGKMPRIVRNGQIILVNEGNFKGVWRVFSAKNNASGIALDIGVPDVVRLKNKVEGHKINVLLSSLLKAGLAPLHPSLVGLSSK